jgi:hypothetical protein
MRKLLLLAALLLVGCTSESDAMRALSAEGYKDVKFTGYDWFACAKDDTFHTGFTAINRDGKVVSGVVCSGLVFKNATIRY